MARPYGGPLSLVGMALWNSYTASALEGENVAVASIDEILRQRWDQLGSPITPSLVSTDNRVILGRACKSARWVASDRTVTVFACRPREFTAGDSALIRDKFHGDDQARAFSRRPSLFDRA